MKDLDLIVSKRPFYPSNRLTFWAKDFNEGKIDWINVYLKSNLPFDVEMIFEISVN